MKPIRPEQRPLTPVPEAKPEPNEVLSIALGRTTEGRYCVAALTTRGLKVAKADVLCAYRDAATAEEEWNRLAYLALFQGNVAPPESGRHVFATGTAIALPKVPPSKRAAIALEVEGNTVTSQKVVFEGSKLDAWNEAQDWASRNLLLESAAQRRRAAQ